MAHHEAAGSGVAPLPFPTQPRYVLTEAGTRALHQDAVTAPFDAASSVAAVMPRVWALTLACPQCGEPDALTFERDPWSGAMVFARAACDAILSDRHIADLEDEATDRAARNRAVQP